MKIMLVWLGVVIGACAQPSVTITTNRLLAASKFRDVDGQLYNTQLSAKWNAIQAPFDILASPWPDLILLQSFAMQGSYRVTGVRQGVLNSPGGIPSSIDYGEQKVLGGKLFVRNFPFVDSKKPYWQLRAMHVGATNYLGSMVDIYDCGTPHYVTVVRTNRIKTPSP